MTAAPGLADKVVRLDRALTRADVPHAFGGALALAYYATPRATVDIDINIFLPVERFDPAVLRRLGVQRIPDATVVMDRGQARAWWGRNPIDLFFSYDPIHEAMRLGARPVPFGRATIPILAPEHLMVAKAAFNRPKDWLDIEQMLIAVGDLDVGEVTRWMTHLVGDADARAVRLAGLVALLRAGNN